MEVFDIYHSIDHAQGPSPLTQVDFFHTKHRAIKKAHAEVAARGLQPPKSVASSITDGAPFIHTPRKGKHAAIAGDSDASKMGAVSPAGNSSSNSRKENFRDMSAASSSSDTRKQRVVVHRDDEDKTPSSKRSHIKSGRANDGESLPAESNSTMLLGNTSSQP
ncbi:hypothetical protein CLCR_11253 [Cladophialophora carrionii]|uniref:Uncharacterized protein n=1 Tax=Cladophialophora carrionii TaxID=86049 RepID=A0A1C1CE68_9EURO|nr:hypothetical protein CLCR_11253 [Cladophialophora carrionii]